MDFWKCKICGTTYPVLPKDGCSAPGCNNKNLAFFEHISQQLSQPIPPQPIPPQPEKIQPIPPKPIKQPKPKQPKPPKNTNSSKKKYTLLIVISILVIMGIIGVTVAFFVNNPKDNKSSSKETFEPKILVNQSKFESGLYNSETVVTVYASGDIPDDATFEYDVNEDIFECEWDYREEKEACLILNRIANGDEFCELMLCDSDGDVLASKEIEIDFIETSLSASASDLSFDSISAAAKTITLDVSGDFNSDFFVQCEGLIVNQKASKVNDTRFIVTVTPEYSGEELLTYSLFDGDENFVCYEQVRISINGPRVNTEDYVLLSLNESQTIDVTMAGDLPSNYNYNLRYDIGDLNGVSCEWIDDEYGNCTGLTITGTSHCNGDIILILTDKPTNQIISKKRISVVVLNH